jgi:hypothetical protein
MDSHIKFEVNCDILKVLNIILEDIDNISICKSAYHTMLKQSNDIQKR